MKIHRTLAGESADKIAEKYGISEEFVRRLNDMDNLQPTEGEELLILTPTRTYTVKQGDTPERIALRFGIRKKDIYMQNPWLCGATLTPGEKLALRYDDRVHGMSVANGYFYKGCSEERLRRVMPFLTYVTFASALANERGISRTLDVNHAVKLVSEEKKIPLMRVHDNFPERYKSDKDLTRFAEEMIELAQEGGYKGIVLDSCSLSDSADEFSSFLMILRKMLIGCDLILITEINEESPIEFSEYADGSALYYPKYAFENPPSFEEGEKHLLADFACRGESAKTFVDIPALAARLGSYTTIDDALNTARRNKYCINNNENTLLSHLRDRKQGEYKFASLSCVKAILDLIAEFDYMGICFDIMRTPLSHLMMYNAMFKTSYYTSVRSAEGCSRVGEE